MPDDTTEGQIPEVELQPNVEAGTGTTVIRSAAVRPRRPRPAPTSGYVPGRRSRDAVGMNPIIVPVIAIVALLALVGAVVFDHFHNKNSSTSNTAAVVPTQAPVPTAAPTATPIVPPAPKTTKAGVAAEVNGIVIPMSLFVVESKSTALQMQAGSQDPQTGATTPGTSLATAAGLQAFHQQQSALLKSMIDTEVAVSYAKTHKLAATKAEIDKQLNTYQTQAGGAAAFTKQIASQGLTMPMVMSIISDGVTENKVGDAITKNTPCPCAPNVRHILLAAKDKALATKLAKELQADKGSNFAALAKKYSTDTSNKDQGGELGQVTKGQMVAEFEKAVFSMKVGQISNPVKTQYGWHIIEVTSETPTPASRQAFFTKWLAAQHAKATIKTYVQLPKA